MPHIHQPHHLLDTVIAEQKLQNDAALCRFLDLNPPMLCKVRCGVNPVSAELMIRIHEKTGMTVARIKELAGIKSGRPDTRRRCATFRQESPLLDAVIVENHLRSDAELADSIGIDRPEISKIRTGKNKATPSIIVAIHETYGLPIARIKSLAGLA